MTPLATALSVDFEAAVRQRGVKYLRDGRVQIESASPWHLAATVSGTTDYDVELRRDGAQIRVSCTCPHFESENCKHVWAVVLAADARRFLQGDDNAGQVHLGYGPLDGEAANVAGLHNDVDNDDTNLAEGIARAQFRPVPPASTAPAPKSTRPAKTPDWRRQLVRLDADAAASGVAARESWPAKRELLYVIDVAGAREARGLCLEVFFRDPKKDGTWGKPKSRYLSRYLLDQLPDARDRRLLALLAGAKQLYAYDSYGGYYDDALPPRYRLIDPQPQLLLPDICRTGRCRLRLQREDNVRDWLTVDWDDGEPWRFRLDVRRDAGGRHYEITGALHRGSERLDLATPVLLVDAGVVFMQDRAARLEHHGTFKWIALLREQRALIVPIAQRDELVAELLSRAPLPPVDLPEELRYEEVSIAPRPRIVVKKHTWQHDRLLGTISFDYDGAVVARDATASGIVQADRRRVLLRDTAAETAAAERLRELGWRRETYAYKQDAALELGASRFARVALALVAEGWHVEAEGKLYRSPGRFDFEVTSGIDWFELHGRVEYDGAVAQLPELLQAARRGETMVRLGDGSFGLLPEQWLARYGALAGLGTAHNDHVRFTRSQVGLLDALLAAQPEARCDKVFARARNELERFSGVEAAEPPAGFRGELRPYQKEGLGWLGFLRRFGFGGCLADDMGLGKTVQVLALLEARREARERQRRHGIAAEGYDGASGAASLVVVPKSLIFNWREEAARFAPRLRVLDHTGPLRREGVDHFTGYDVILTTYGTLRNDVVDFKNTRFDYVILDEAQAIKNPTSASAKAARLLQAEHRLALSGTPIENHLGELWSLFEFLNPGMLGTASVFAAHGARAADDETRKILAHALKPFLLRRTKEQVVRDLPPKVEQTLYCEMETKQRRLYDELRDHYRSALLKRIERDGIGRAKIQILEALLRLRQAAIHPGLIDKRRAEEPSAKLDMLLHRLREVLDEGHKTLVFSQFTEMLAILRAHLDRSGIPYEYLDGKTRNRQACVARFQTDGDCKLFLISLKAGGLGLNLTAAQYVFLLDPWWNPAVEAQAVDRAHRIGQANRVFAYRLIARDTIEEKVLELQNAKRDLADAIIGADNSLIRRLSREDLELLLA